MTFQRRIRLFGEEFILIGDLDSGGPIATEEAYQNFDVSYAHLYSNGAIIRYGQQIGTRDDIEILPISVDVEPEVGLDKVLLAMAFPDEWAAG